MLSNNYESPLVRKIKEAITEERERIHEHHDEELYNINKDNQLRVMKAWVLGLVVGGGLGALTASYLAMYIHALSKQ